MGCFSFHYLHESTVTHVTVSTKSRHQYNDIFGFEKLKKKTYLGHGLFTVLKTIFYYVKQVQQGKYR